MQPERISVHDLKRGLDRGDRMTIVDARGRAAWEESDYQLAGAIRVPPDDIESHLSEIPRDRMVVAYCT